MRSFAGDLAGLVRRLDHLERLGVDAVWLSPVHPSPNVDWGYDVADYLDVHPDFGTLADYDALVAEAARRNIDVWLDLVPNHTSDRHAWFTDRPEYYVWSADVPNDWRSVFTGGSAWTWDARRKRYYLHQFAPQQPDLDWWNDDVRAEFDAILRFWFDRGVRGLRIDVAHGLVKDRELRDGVEHMRNRPEVHEIYRRWQEIAAAYDPKPTLMGETYVLSLPELYPYWQHLDLAQNFPFVRAGFELGQLRPIVEQTMAHLPPDRRAVWFASNHDHSRLATRWAGGDEAKIRAALFLLLTLPGVAILYQGDELGLEDGRVPPGRVVDLADPPRDPERTPLPWTRSGAEWRDPWLPLEDTSRNVEDQEADPGSILHYTRDLIRARRGLDDRSYETLPSPDGVWAYARGARACVLNLTSKPQVYDGERLAPWEGRLV
ncbi:MAG TPA: alpha-amylase family glycosyl hydrolase [Gaiellaceae bacterium]|nr:alpha-amylase family glycosyl hydrolase [Gaiellaceae bacterium]